MAGDETPESGDMAAPQVNGKRRISWQHQFFEQTLIMKKTVFLTGATGNMGRAGFRELLKKKDRFNIRILARPSKKNKKALAEYATEPAVEIIWGDLTDYEDVLKGVTGADFVLHVGGMVSPQADYYPEKTLKVNVSAAENIVRAVKAQPDADNIKVVYIGSSRFDKYSVSKCIAEKIIADSGIRYWVSLRQSGILYPGIFRQINPVALHVPVQGVLEWATIEDSGRLLANVVEDWVPEEFWNRFYNISSGEQYRLVNYDFENRLLKPLGISSVEKVFEPQWFATRNFHGMWYTDADVLEGYLHFRENVPVDEYFRRLASELPWYYSLARIVPSFIIKAVMRSLACAKGLGTQSWIKEGDTEKINAYYGSLDEYRKIRSWEQLRPKPLEKNIEKARLAGQVAEIDRGYDTSKPIYSLTADEIRAAVAFRGGEFLGPEAEIGKKGSIFRWKCENGHEFEASLEYVLLGGGWCTECDIDCVCEQTTRKNRFISEVLYPQSRQ